MKKDDIPEVEIQIERRRNFQSSVPADLWCLSTGQR